MSEPETPQKPEKLQPYTIEELREMVEKAKSEKLSPEVLDWLHYHSVQDPRKAPELIARAKRMGIEIPGD